MNEKRKWLPTIEDVQHAFSRIPKQWILAFVAACVVFIVFHAGYFDDRMVNEDFRHYLIRSTQNYSAGRFLHFHLTNNYVNSWTLGCTSCFFMALSAILVVDLFRIRTRIGAILTAVLLVGMPALSYMYSFLFSASYYSEGYFFALLAVWIADRWRWGFIPAAFLFAVSLGVLQSTLVAAPVLCILVLLRGLVFEEKCEYKKLLYKGLRFLIVGVVGVGLYFLMWRVVRSIHNVEISTYRGMDQLGHFDLNQMAAAFLKSYRDIWSFFFGSDYFYTSVVQKIAYAVLLLTSAFASLFTLIKKPVRIPGFLICAFLIPPCLGSIAILVPAMETDTHLIYSVVYAIVFTIRLAEDSVPGNTLGRVTAWLLLASLFATCISFLDVTSAFYVKSEAYQEHTMAYENRLLSRIEETPGYYIGIPVAIISNNTNEAYRGLAASDFPRVINDRDMWYSYVGSYTNSYKKTINLISAYTGVNLTKVKDAQIDKIHYSPEFREMSAYPLAGSTRVMDGILVVNCVYRDVAVMQADSNTVLVDYISHTPVDENTVYAWYVYRNGERVSELERGYHEVSAHMVTLTEDGTYSFRGYCNEGGVKQKAYSFSVVVENGVIVPNENIQQISMEEALDRALPPIQVSAQQVGELEICLTVIDNYLHVGPDYTYAWRVYRGDEHLTEYDREFAAEARYDLVLKENGQYHFELIYRKGEGAEVAVQSDTVDVVRVLDISLVGGREVLLDYIGPTEEGKYNRYAWYVYKDGERMTELDRGYQTNPAYLVALEEDGVYSFRCFVKSGEEKWSIPSFPVTVEGGVIRADERLGTISPEDAARKTKAEIEISVTVVDDRAVKLTIIDNYLNAGPEYAYAWYVYRDGERLTEYDRGYFADPEYDLILAEAGEYQFKLFYRVGDVKKSLMSEKFMIGDVQSAENAA